MDQYGPSHSLELDLRLTSVISAHRGKARDLRRQRCGSRKCTEREYTLEREPIISTRCNSPEQESVASATENVSIDDNNLGMQSDGRETDPPMEEKTAMAMAMPPMGAPLTWKVTGIVGESTSGTSRRRL
jgi:hypothetical protein